MTSTKMYRRYLARSIGAAIRPAANCRLLAIALAIFVMCLGGCGKSPANLAPVHGVVSVDGQPLAQGKVLFSPTAAEGGIEAGKPALGTLQPDGSYTLTTYDDGDGAVVGQHWVTVLWPNPNAKSTSPAPGVPARKPPMARFKVRERKAVVAGQDNQIDIQLTRQDVAQAIAK